MLDFMTFDEAWRVATAPDGSIWHDVYSMRYWEKIGCKWQEREGYPRPTLSDEWRRFGWGSLLQ